MNFVIRVDCAPYNKQATTTAYEFIRAAAAKGHRIIQVFFYYDGIYNAVRGAHPPDDEIQWTQRWASLARQYRLDLAVCVSAAQRRGLTEPRDNATSGDTCTLAEGFRISGLGQFIEATLQADRVLVFGG